MSNPVIFVFNNTTSGINPTTFVPLLIPKDCNVYLLKNIGPDAMYMRSDIADPNTEDVIASGNWEDLSPMPFVQSVLPYRYAMGTVLYYVKATGPIVGKFWI